MIIESKEGRGIRIGMFATPKQEDYERVEEAIEDLELQKLADRAVSHLSGGERQRVAVARSIVQNSEVILFDEPTSALDFGNQIRVMRTCKHLTERGYAVVMTTHNPANVTAFTFRSQKRHSAREMCNWPASSPCISRK